MRAVATADFDGERAYVLRDAAGAEAWVLPGIGANCVAFRTPVGGKIAHLLSTPPSLEAFRSRTTFWGFPILSPYPGRHQTPFTWRGKQYAIAANDRPGVAIHGIVAGVPWEVVEAGESELRCRFDSETFPNRGERWPWPFVLTARHHLEHGALTLELELENRAEEEVPHLLGLHPYFPVRFTASGDADPGPLATAAQLAGDRAPEARETCRVWVAADERWEMEAGLGTGEIRRLEEPYDLRRPKAVAELERDSGWVAAGGQAGRRAMPVLLYAKRGALRLRQSQGKPDELNGVISGIRDEASGIEMTLDCSAGFGSLALFCPPGQPFISLEPRSAVSDALTLANDPRGISTGIWPLAPGETWRGWARISAKPIAR